MLKRLSVGGFEGSWLSDHCHAEVHTFYHPDDSPACVVCIREGVDTANVALTLSHEALHIFRRWCEHIGEDSPGEEIEAHCIKNIAVSLVSEYEKRRDQ